MARGNRTYNRDSRGRFASGGGGSTKSSGGSLSARRSLRQSRSKLAAMDPADRSIKGQLSRRSQKGAVTRANKRLIEAKKASQRRMPTQKKASRISAPAGFKKGQGVKRGSGKPAYRLTTTRLADMLSEHGDSKAMRAIKENRSAFPKGSKRRLQTVQTQRAANMFNASVQAEASRYYRQVGENWPLARVAAFAQRPTYSTRQGVRRRWGARVNPSATQQRGW